MKQIASGSSLLSEVFDEVRLEMPIEERKLVVSTVPSSGIKVLQIETNLETVPKDLQHPVLPLPVCPMVSTIETERWPLKVLFARWD